MPSADPTAMPAANTRFPREALLGCAVALALAGLTYLNALPNPFIYDDHHTVLANPSLKSGNLLAMLLYDRTRPLVNLTYAWDDWLWTGRAIGFRVTNLALHVVNVGLLYVLSWRLAEDRRQLRAETEAPTLVSPAVTGFVVASLFAVHPLLSESVGYISARHEVLCATFFLLGMLSGRRWLATDRGRLARPGAPPEVDHELLRGRRVRWGVATVVLWVLAMATKEVGAMLPFALLAYDVFWCDAEGRRARLIWIHAPLVAIAAALGVGRLLFLTYVEFPGQAGLRWEFLWLALDVIRRYASLLTIPIGQTAFHAVAPVPSVLDAAALVALLTLGLMLTVAWQLRHVRWLGSLGLVWFLLLLAPGAVLTLFNQGEPMSEHRVYLASCGFMMATGDALAWVDASLRRLGRMHVMGRVGFAIVLLTTASLTMTRNRMWGAPLALWGESVDLAPNHPRPRVLLGEALEDAGRLEEASDEYRTALRLQPTNVDAHIKLGQLLTRTGRLDEAREHITRALEADPNNEFARQSMAVIDQLSTAPAAGFRP
jgi:protein O-mannosyl-transferase